MLLIKIHSTAGTITNSSTELFVCNTQKTVEQINEMLDLLSQAIGKHHGVGRIEVKNGPVDLLELLRGELDYYADGYGVREVVHNFIGYPAGVEMVPNIPGRDSGSYRLREGETYEDREIRLEAAREEAWSGVLRWFEENDALLQEKVGQFIVLTGESDNTIPYELFDVLRVQLNAISFHLG